MRKWLKNMEPASGIEPPTYGLRNRSSTDDDTNQTASPDNDPDDLAEDSE